jgi:hypothetical protein
MECTADNRYVVILKGKERNVHLSMPVKSFHYILYFTLNFLSDEKLFGGP